MANEVKLTLKIKDDGTLDITAKKAKRAAQETEKLAKSTDRASQARNRYNRGEKGVAQAGMNTTKSFSKMRDTMGGGSSGLVGAYATLAANVFALTAAFGILQRTAQLEQLIVGFETLANTAGRTSSIIVKSIQEITDGAVSGEQAFRAAAAGFNAGFSQIEIERLTKIAKNASQALGRNLPDSLDRLIRGTAKLEPEILDELGIFVRLDDAVQKYAETLGKTAPELTEAERRQSFLNAALSQGELKFSGIGDSIPANPFDKLAANFEKLSKNFLNIVNTIIGPVVGLLATSTIALVGALLIFGRTITSAMFPAIEGLGEKYVRMAEQSKSAATAAREANEDLTKSSMKALMSDSDISKKSKFAAIQKRVAKGQKVSLEELQEAQKSLAISEDSRAKNIKNNSVKNIEAKKAELEIIRAQKRAVEDLIAQEQGRTGPQRKEKMADRSLGTYSTLAEDASGIAGSGALEGFKKAREGLNKYRADKRTLFTVEIPALLAKNTVMARMYKVLAIRFRVAGAAARLFGLALLNAIPVIGQILVGVGLVVTAFGALFRAVFPVSKAMQQFDEVTGSAKEKVDQLSEANEKLESKYYGVLRAQLLTKKGVDNLTIAELKEIETQAKAFSQVEEYANTLKVSAGITTEFAGAVDLLSQELTSIEEPGFLGTLAAYIKEGIYSGIEDGLEAISNAVKKIANFLSNLELIQTLRGWRDAVGDFLSDIARRAVGDDIANSFDIAPVLTKVRTYRNDVIDQFETLRQNAKPTADAIEKQLGMSFESFVKSQLSGVKATTNFNDAQAEFKRGTIAISGVLKQASIQSQAAADSILKFGENTRKGGVALTNFRTKFFKKNEFAKLAEDVRLTQDAVAALQKTSEASEGELSFIDALNRAVAAGEIDLRDYGLTAEEVAKDGGAAFDTLLSKIDAADLGTRNLKNDLAALKGELAIIKAQFASNEAFFKLVDMEEGLRKSGQAVQLVGRGLNDLADKEEARLNNIREQGRVRKEIINTEIDLELLKLDILRTSGKLNKDQLATLDSVERALKKSRQSRIGQVNTETQGAEFGIKSDTLGERSQLQQRLASIGDGAGSTGEAIRALSREFEALAEKGATAFQTLDSDGNVIGNNFALQFQMVTSAMAPMLNNLRSLGPEGETTAAMVGGIQMIIESLMVFADTLERVMGVEALGSFESFGAAWDSMDFKQKAQVASAAFSMAAQSIAGLSQALAAQSRNAIQGIDNQIEREKKLDGKSAESVQKIKALEAKKEQMKRKAFETDKKMKLAQAIMSTAAGVAAALTVPFVGPALAVMVGALGAAQVAIISGMTYQGGGGANAGNVSQINAGKRGTSADLATSQGARGELAYFRGEQGTGGPGNFKSAFGGYKNRAEGGNTAYMVGEQGPELFVPGRPGSIVANDDIAAGGGPTSVSFNINTIDASGVEDMLTAQRGNIIGMIRQAANSYGEDFVESVDTSVFTPLQRGAVDRY